MGREYLNSITFKSLPQCDMVLSILRHSTYNACEAVENDNVHEACLSVVRRLLNMALPSLKKFNLRRSALEMMEFFNGKQSAIKGPEHALSTANNGDCALIIVLGALDFKI